MKSRGERRRFNVLLVLFVLVSVQAGADARHVSDGERPFPTLVTAEWLSQHLEDPDLVVLDCTVRIVPDENGGMLSESGRADYEQGHIPTAGFADLLGPLSDPDSPLKFSLPSPEDFCAAMAALGVGDDSSVVLYDGNYSVWAARVWWMLRWVGHDQAAVLDGGLRAWKAEERPLSTEPAAHRPGKLAPRVRPFLIADRDEVFAAISDDTVVLIDTMPEAHFEGKMALYARPGHIPGAANVPATALLDESGRFRPLAELAEHFAQNPKQRSITYCGSGIAASAAAFVMHRLGFDDIAVYVASLQEWAADPANPLVVEKN